MLGGGASSSSFAETPMQRTVVGFGGGSSGCRGSTVIGENIEPLHTSLRLCQVVQYLWAAAASRGHRQVGHRNQEHEVVGRGSREEIARLIANL